MLNLSCWILLLISLFSFLFVEYINHKICLVIVNITFLFFLRLPYRKINCVAQIFLTMTIEFFNWFCSKIALFFELFNLPLLYPSFFLFLFCWSVFINMCTHYTFKRSFLQWSGKWNNSVIKSINFAAYFSFYALVNFFLFQRRKH